MTGSYGIDFGTTNSVLARLTAAGVETVPLDDELPAEWANLGFDRVLPSVIALRRTAGRRSAGRRKPRAGSRLEAVKRLFATDDVVTVGGARCRSRRRRAAVRAHPGAGRRGPAPLDQAVVTIPANSRGLARARTKLAAGLAGIDVLALINEPTAAAMAHARRDRRPTSGSWSSTGAAARSTSPCCRRSRARSSSRRPRASSGSAASTSTRRSWPRCAPHAARRRRLDARPNATGSGSRLELAKIQLSEPAAVEVELPDGGAVRSRRDFFEAAIRPLIERTREPLGGLPAGEPRPRSTTW